MSSQMSICGRVLIVVYQLDMAQVSHVTALSIYELKVEMRPLVARKSKIFWLKFCVSRRLWLYIWYGQRLNRLCTQQVEMVILC